MRDAEHKKQRKKEKASECSYYKILNVLLYKRKKNEVKKNLVFSFKISVFFYYHAFPLESCMGQVQLDQNPEIPFEANLQPHPNQTKKISLICNLTRTQSAM